MNFAELLKGTLDTIILRLLSERDKMYGYEIIQLVKKLSGDKFHLKPGSIYPALHKLESAGLLTTHEVSVGKRIRKYYRITPAGQDATTEAVNDMLAFLSALYHIVHVKPKKPYVVDFA